MADFWQETAQMFGSIFDKPPMKEKLLMKPPFKYLLDIIHETIKSTGFFKGLYTDEELSEKFYDTREKKVLFLQKIMEATKSVTKENIEARPSKILAGQEPELTNAFLQAMYRATISGEDSDAHVKSTLKKFASAGQAEEKQAPPQAAPEKKAPEKKVTKKEEAPKPAEPPAKREPEKKRTAPPPADEEERKAPPKSSSKEGKLVRPPSAKKGEKAGPKIIKESAPRADEEEAEDMRAPSPSNRNNLAINDIDSKAHGEFVRQALDDAKQASAAETTKEKADTNPGIKMTSLRNRKKTSSDAKTVASKDGPKIDEAQPSSVPSGNDTETVKTILQGITKNANPLGRAVEFLGDDIEQMNKELLFWRKSQKEFEERYTQEKKATDETLQPLIDKITDIEEQIRDQKAKIQSTKTAIMRNTSSINDHLSHVVNSKQKGRY